MKVDFSVLILDHHGKEIPDAASTEDPKASLTLRDVCHRSLLQPSTENQALTLEEKLKRGRLADKIFGTHEPINLSAEQLTLLKAEVAKTQTIFMTTKVCDLVDPQPEA
jgi:hypothetical protein